MCYLCDSSRRWSRRRFLVAGSAAAMLAACGAGEGPEGTAVPLTPTVTPTAQPTPTLRVAVIPSAEPTLAPRGLPHFGGEVAALAANTLTLVAPVGTRRFELAVAAPVAVGDEVAIWVEGEQITAVQKLPPFSATEEIPDNWVQGEVTGEKRPLGEFDLITRAGWGAGAANWFGTGGESGVFDTETNLTGQFIYPEPLGDWLNTLVVHHSALTYLDGPREIQRLHILQNGFADVGYHFFVDGLGQVYEGRPLNERGAHTGGYNTGTLGICLLGNFEIIQPARAQLSSLQAVAVYLRDAVGINYLAGHRSFQPDATVCPGANLWPLLPKMAKDTGLLWGTDGYVVPEWGS